MKIYTLTMNPALDYVINVSGLVCGNVNRANSQKLVAAGKGVNVSLALKRMGVDSTAICLCGDGFAGTEFSCLLKCLDLNHVLIPVKGCDTRINVKVRSGSDVTELNGTFCADETAIEKICEFLDTLESDDILIMSGSLPSNVSPTFYADISAKLSVEKQVKVIADTSGEALRHVIQHDESFLISPNREELVELCGVAVEGLEDAVKYSANLDNNILVSMGEKGAAFIGKGGKVSYVCKSPEKFKNCYAVGAGDTLLAGFVAEYIKSEDFEKSLTAGVNAATEFVGNDGK
jgi:1-phosphofructokinase